MEKNKNNKDIKFHFKVHPFCLNYESELFVISFQIEQIITILNHTLHTHILIKENIGEIKFRFLKKLLVCKAMK
jgi:hypothetical protein